MGTLRKRPPPIERATDAFRCFPQVENPTLEIYPGLSGWRESYDNILNLKYVIKNVHAFMQNDF